MDEKFIGKNKKGVKFFKNVMCGNHRNYGIYIAETPDGDRNYIAVFNGDIIFENKSIEALCVDINIREYLRTMP